MEVNLTPFALLLGAIIAVADNLLIITLLIARLANKPRLEHWLGIVLLTTALPLVYLIVDSLSSSPPLIYLVWLGLMILYLLIELMLDYVLKYPFRQVRWMAITYVMLLFGATGGMIGVASLAGRVWMLSAVVTFLGMATIAFYQRHKTGL